MDSSDQLTGALLDHFTHHVHILELNGDDYRLKQSKGRRRKTVPDGNDVGADATGAKQPPVVDPDAGKITA